MAEEDENGKQEVVGDFVSANGSFGSVNGEHVVPWFKSHLSPDS